MPQDGAMPQQEKEYKNLAELKKIDPEFDFSKAYVFHGRFGRTLVMVFVEQLKEPLKTGYFIDGEKIFEKNAKFQISFREFGIQKIYKFLVFFFTTEEKAFASIDEVLSKENGLFQKIEEKDILEFMNRDVEDEE